MKLKTLIIASILIVLSSCHKNENGIPNIPESQLIDMDNDGNVDFSIVYYSALIHSSTSSEGIICRFETVGENEILSKDGESLLFLNDTNEVKVGVNDPLKWKSDKVDLAYLTNHFEDGWPEKWDLATNDIKDSYFIGVKLNKANSVDKGWIEIEIDENSGSVNILEKKIL